MKTVIGLDFGSDSVRAVLVTENGAVLASCVKNYPRWMEGLYSNPATSQFRQHPLDYIVCVCFLGSSTDTSTYKNDVQRFLTSAWHV